MNNEKLIQCRLKAMGPTYRLFYRQPVHLVRGEGVWLHDSDGHKYLD
jgi:4-aminobutyrate aminotransferase-like enzyme